MFARERASNGVVAGASVATRRPIKVQCICADGRTQVGDEARRVPDQNRKLCAVLRQVALERRDIRKKEVSAVGADRVQQVRVDHHDRNHQVAGTRCAQPRRVRFEPQVVAKPDDRGPLAGGGFRIGWFYSGSHIFTLDLPMME